MKFDSMDIVKAMQIIAESNTAKLRLDRTIVARIISVENVETGEYRVAYEGNTFLAYSYDVKVSFAVDDNVYVKIPENDMSNRKIIEGRTTSSGNTLTDIIDQQVDVNTIEPSFDKFYEYDAKRTYGLVAGVGSDHPQFSQTIFDSKSSTTGDHMFQSYAANYGKIKITGSFYTKFTGVHRKGNYGLIVTFKTHEFDDEGNEIQGTISYRLDFNSFVGDPYRYTSPSPQSVIIDVFKDSVIGLDSILFFQENFETDKSVNYDDKVIYENKGEDEPPICNIFVQDIDISFCEVIDLRDTSYYLTIATPQGIVFSGDTTSLTLDARLKYKGSNILSQNSCKAYWYKENLSIKKGDEKYDKLAGVRWEKINPQDNDFLSSITIDAEDVQTHAKYNLVVVYQDVILSKEIEIKQLNPSHDLKIQQISTNNSRIVLQVVSKLENDNRDYSADWYFLLPDGSYDLIPDGEKKSEIDVTNYLIYPTATFYCQTYCDDEPISIESYNFSVSDSKDDLSITYIGQDIFQYDANGDIAYEDAERERTLGVEVQWKEGFGSAYNVSYLAPDGIELSRDRARAHTAANSMMENLWVDSTNILHYNIRQKYNINYNNNIITVKIKNAVNGSEYIFNKEILFLKDGDQGTNGTTYICAVRPVNLTNGNKLSGFHALSYDDAGWGKELDLRCYVYKNGELLNNNSNFELKFEWECGSKDADKNDKLWISEIPNLVNLFDYKNVQGVGVLDPKGDYVVKVTVDIREKSNNEDTEIHCLYPVDVAVGGLQMGYIDMNLPSYVKYTASGINAVFLNQELKCTYNGNDTSIYSTDESLLQITNNKLNPAQKFQYIDGIAALRCEVTPTMYLLHPIMMYLDTYGNEAINGWDGTKLELDNGGNYILAPQIGAGKKNADNTFTGVVMGRDTAEDKIGLYGYRYGITQFGLKEDGTAFIGATGQGQILFNGNKGTITSGNYSPTEGMKIELDSGHIDAFNFKLSSGNMLLDSSNQKFEFTVGELDNSQFLIKHKNGNALFKAKNDGYFLQSQDYESGKQGTKFDLASGRIDSHNFNLRSSCLTINSENNNFTFDVSAGYRNGSFAIKAGDKTLINVSNNNYYLQSSNYNNMVSGTEARGIRIDLQNGNINAVSGNIGGWRITGTQLRSNDGTIYLGTNGLKFGNYFSVSSSGASINGTLRAQDLYLGNSPVSALLNGLFNGGQIADGSVGTAQIAARAITAEKIMSHTITAEQLKADAIIASKIAAGSVSIGGNAGYIKTGSAVSASYALEIESTGGLRLKAGTGSAYIAAGEGKVQIDANGLTSVNNFQVNKNLAVIGKVSGTYFTQLEERIKKLEGGSSEGGTEKQ